VERKSTTLPEHMSSSLVFSGVRVAESLVFCVVFWRSLFVLLSFSFAHCMVCPLHFLITPLVSSIFSYTTNKIQKYPDNYTETPNMLAAILCVQKRHNIYYYIEYKICLVVITQSQIYIINSTIDMSAER